MRLDSKSQFSGREGADEFLGQVCVGVYVRAHIPFNDCPLVARSQCVVRGSCRSTVRPVAAAQGGKWAEPRDIRKVMARGDGLDVGGQGATLRVWRGHLRGGQGRFGK